MQRRQSEYPPDPHLSCTIQRCSTEGKSQITECLVLMTLVLSSSKASHPIFFFHDKNEPDLSGFKLD